MGEYFNKWNMIIKLIKLQNIMKLNEIRKGFIRI